MNRIFILFKFALAIIPFYLFTYLIHYTFRTISGWMSFFLNLILLIGLVYFIIKSRKKYFEEEQNFEDIPEQFKQSSYLYLILGCVAGHMMVFADFRSTLYIDNGNPYPIKVEVADLESLSIPANSHKETSSFIGINEIQIN